MRELTLREASNLDAKRKEEVNEKTTVVDDRPIIKAVKINPKRHVCKIPNNLGIGPRLWNSLPPEIRVASSLSIFKSLLKTHLFDLAY